MNMRETLKTAPGQPESEKASSSLAAHSLPIISLVTCSYQQGRYLDATLRSVLDQDYPALEYLVIDGGSRDGSIDILRRHEAALAGWVSEPDKGQTDALIKGFAQIGRAHV